MKIIDRSSGMLMLLLMVWVLFFSKTIFDRPKPESILLYDKNGFIQVAGDVPGPGVYPLYGLSPIKSILSNEAGLTIMDDISQNISSPSIQSGMKVTVLREGEKWRLRFEEMSAFYKSTLGIPISLNQESEEGLSAIPGVGPQLAKAIVQTRDKRGRFRDLSEIMSIKGIGPGLLKKIRAYATL